MGNWLLFLLTQIGYVGILKNGLLYNSLSMPIFKLTQKRAN